MKHITEWTDRRIHWAERYDEGLKDAEAIKLPVRRPGYRHVYHLYVVETIDPAKRASLLGFLNDADIDAKTHYSIAIHEQDGFPWGKPYEIVGSLSNAEVNAASCVSLPMFPELTAEQVDAVIEKVMEWDRQNRS